MGPFLPADRPGPGGLKGRGTLDFCSRAMRGAPRREFEAVKPPRTARSHGPRRRSRLAARDSLSFERAKLSRDVARILRILAASGKSSISRTDERRDASFEPRSSVALLPVVSSRGTAARVAGSAGNLFRGGYAATPAGRGTFGPSRSSAHGADCLREPAAPSLLASPGERRSPEPAAQGAANVRVRRACRGLSEFLNPSSEHYRQNPRTFKSRAERFG